MSIDLSKADQIAFHFYTKLFYVLNDARATEEPKTPGKVDKWFNLETPDSDLFTREAREPYRTLSTSKPRPFELQVLLKVPELSNNHALVYTPPNESRIRIERNKRYILLEQWTMQVDPGAPVEASGDKALPIIYKHGIVLFRSLFSLLRVLPAWRLHNRLHRKVSAGGMSIELRVRNEVPQEQIHMFGEPIYQPLPTATHEFTPIPQPFGAFVLRGVYLTNPTFKVDELESVLSSRFLSLDKEGFIPTLDKNRQRDSISGSEASSLPSSSGTRSVFSRSPPRAIARGPSGGSGADNVSIADRFIIPSRVTSIGAPTLGITSATGSTALIPPPRPFPTHPQTTNIPAQPIPASGLALNRLRKESLNSSSSSVGRNDPYTSTTHGGTTSLSSSPVSGAAAAAAAIAMPIRRPSINPVHPFKSNTLSSASASPTLSIRQVPPLSATSGSPVLFPSSPLSGTGVGMDALRSHTPTSQTSSPSMGAHARLPPSPMGSSGFAGIHPSPPGYNERTFSPSSLGDRRPGTSGSSSNGAGSYQPHHTFNRDRSTSTSTNANVSISGRVASPVPSTGGAGEGERQGVPVPQRKRYSSTFGYRYTGSVGSTTSIPTSTSGVSAGAPGSGSGGGGSGQGNAIAFGGRATPASIGSHRDRSLGPTQDRRIESPSYLNTNTDDDDISIFVQDIDARKPLSGRERELREQEQGADSWSSRRTHGRAFSESHATDNRYFDGPYAPSPPVPLPLSAGRRGASGGIPTPSTQEAEAFCASTSPTGGPMLTSEDAVDERLRMMNETFRKSLEVIGDSQRRRAERVRPSREGTMDSTEGDGRSTHSGSTNSSAATARPLRRDSGIESPTSPRSQSYQQYNTQGMGLGIGRVRYPSTSSSGLAQSDGGASQGSQEVLGKMDLYEDRRLRGAYNG
ncbi:hypothetical protein D9619_010220 [Psilocybe cf. subviscida]|uniref:Autophagy-related protein 13 n=1 Tax=Psilocybe cf. subviscida TaxID=2480587 RepID=A0A8H5AST7_9AGAR|nr:hypothetical protein D9619_010220 [Psilocybe cf. subviscida]